MADVTQATVLGESTLIPYMRKQDIAFDADNLRPRKLARIFFDDIAMNGFTQRGNKIVLNSEKVLTITPNTTYSWLATDYLYQGSSNASPTFSANVKSYSGGQITLYDMSGNFDVSANVLIEKIATGITVVSAGVTREVNSNTSDIFFMNEGVFSPNTNTFMKVVGSSGENILYVNENFINANLAAINVALTAVHFTPGDLVYQTVAGKKEFDNALFTGKVEYYNSANGALAITPLTGRFNTNTSANLRATLWNASNTTSPDFRVSGVKLVDVAAGHRIASVTSPTKNVAAVSYVHTSGAFSNVSANTIEGGGQYVYLNATAPSDAVGNVFYITAGTGLGQFKRVTAATGKRLTLISALAVDPGSNSKYSVGNHYVDENGSLNGILNVPEEPNFKFKTGERVLTITDVDKLDSDDYTMKASARYASGGLRNSLQRINLTPIMKPLPATPPNNPVMPPPPTQRLPSPAPVTPPTIPAVPRPIPITPVRRRKDPVAQTFWTPAPDSNKVNYGVFITAVQLFFGAKPNTARGSLQLPIQVKIAEVVNGYPTENFVAEASVKCKDVKVSASPSVSDSNTITTFRFRDPVFLAPDTEYALVILSDSPEYEVYVAELGGNVLGADPPQRISEQPYSGSFFRSQNSSTWTAYQNEDLMFVIKKAVFSPSGTASFQMKDVPEFDMNVDRMFINADKLTFPVSDIDFAVKGVFKANSNYDVNTRITPQTIFKYGDLMDASNKAGTANFNNARKLITGNANSVQVLAEFATSDSDVSPVFNLETLAVVPADHDINNGGISNTVISIVNRGAGYNALQIPITSNVIKGGANTTQNNAAQLFRETYLANNPNLGFYYVNIATDGYGSGAEGFAVANTDGQNTVNFIVMTSEGSGYIKTPTSNIATGNFSSGMIPAMATTQGEDGKRGGNMSCRYITRQIALEDGFEAGDLRVFLDAVTPVGTDIQVYYKVLGSEDPERFDDKSWQLMYKLVDKKSKDSRQVIELQFRPDLLENKLKYMENGRQYPIGGKFKFFAVKVVLMAVDTTVAPWVQNLRIIATPEG
jgi:hypothetical protein